MKTVEAKTAKQAFRERLEKLKPNLPVGYKAKFFKANPDYDTASGATLLNNVIAGRSTDTTILEALEKMAKKGGKNA